jgi:transcriptional regulator with XRE-family HTH domain
MTKTDLVAAVAKRMAELGLTQTELAAACGLSQPHMSKILKKRLKLAKKTQERLGQWLERAENKESSALESTLRAVASKIRQADGKSRMQIMQFLTALDGLLDLKAKN